MKPRNRPSYRAVSRIAGDDGHCTYENRYSKEHHEHLMSHIRAYEEDPEKYPLTSFVDCDRTLSEIQRDEPLQRIEIFRLNEKCNKVAAALCRDNGVDNTIENPEPEMCANTDGIDDSTGLRRSNCCSDTNNNNEVVNSNYGYYDDSVKSESESESQADSIHGRYRHAYVPGDLFAGESFPEDAPTPVSTISPIEAPGLPTTVASEAAKKKKGKKKKRSGAKRKPKHTGKKHADHVAAAAAAVAAAAAAAEPIALSRISGDQDDTLLEIGDVPAVEDVTRSHGEPETMKEKVLEVPTTHASHNESEIRYEADVSEPCTYRSPRKSKIPFLRSYSDIASLTFKKESLSYDSEDDSEYFQRGIRKVQSLPDIRVLATDNTTGTTTESCSESDINFPYAESIPGEFLASSMNHQAYAYSDKEASSDSCTIVQSDAISLSSQHCEYRSVPGEQQLGERFILPLILLNSPYPNLVCHTLSICAWQPVCSFHKPKIGCGCLYCPLPQRSCCCAHAPVDCVHVPMNRVSPYEMQVPSSSSVNNHFPHRNNKHGFPLTNSGWGEFTFWNHSSTSTSRSFPPPTPPPPPPQGSEFYQDQNSHLSLSCYSLSPRLPPDPLNMAGGASKPQSMARNPLRKSSRSPPLVSMSSNREKPDEFIPAVSALFELSRQSRSNSGSSNSLTPEEASQPAAKGDTGSLNALAQPFTTRQSYAQIVRLGQTDTDAKASDADDMRPPPEHFEAKREIESSCGENLSEHPANDEPATSHNTSPSSIFPEEQASQERSPGSGSDNVDSKPRPPSPLNVAHIAGNLRNQFGKPAYSDFQILVGSQRPQGVQDFRGLNYEVFYLHMATLNASPFMHRLFEAKLYQNVDGLRYIHAIVGSSFNSVPSFGMAVQYLYSMPLIEHENLRDIVLENAPHARSNTGNMLPFEPERSMVSFSLCYATSGVFLDLPEVMERGMKLAYGQLAWSTVELLLHFGMKSREYMIICAEVNNALLDFAHPLPARIYSGQIKEFESMWPSLTLNIALEFIADGITANFELYDRAQAEFIPTRIPPAFWTLPHSSCSDPRLEYLQFGSMPSYAETAPTDKAILVISAMLLTLPFEVFVKLVDILNKREAECAELIQKVVQLREERRINAVRRYQSQHWLPDDLDHPYFAELAYCETVILHESVTALNTKIIQPVVVRHWVELVHPGV